MCIDDDLQQHHPKNSLKLIISNLPDFKEELTLIHHCTQQLGMTFNCSPPNHSEVEGGRVLSFVGALQKVVILERTC